MDEAEIKLSAVSVKFPPPPREIRISFVNSNEHLGTALK